MSNKKEIIEILKECYDPEIPIDLWNLGLIYDININKGKVGISMSLTTPGCSMGQQMAKDIEEKILIIQSVESVDVKITFEPAWKPEMMTDYARNKLGFGVKKTENHISEPKLEWE
tara:strand:+ start:344 stop:691 length:348 start_codon:yes stop_codon:yes gene_type:complete